MNRLRSFLLSCLLTSLFVAADFVSADEPAAEIAEDQLAQLIEQLFAFDREEREMAEQSLLRLGGEILPRLPAIKDLPHASARASLRRVRVILERRAALESLAPSRVNWSREQSLVEAVDQLSEQTGNPIRLDVSAEVAQRSIADRGPLTFWSAVARLEQKAKLSLETKSGTSELILKSGTAKDASRATGQVAAFRWQIDSVTRKTLPQNEQQQLLRINLSLLPEPRLRPLFLKFRMADSVLELDSQVLKPYSPDAVIELPWGDRFRPLPLRLDYLIPATVKSGTLTLQVPLEVELATGTTEVRFENLLTEIDSVRKGGVIVSRGPLERSSTGLKIPLLLAYEAGGPAFESHRNWVYQNELKLVAGEKEYQPDGPLTMTLEADGVLGIEYSFRVVPPDLTDTVLRYRVPILLTRTELKLQTTAFPLPESESQP